MTHPQAGEPVAWLCEFMREDDTTDTQVVLEDPECTRWADSPDGDGVSPYSVTPLRVATTCKWTPQEEGIYKTSCGHAFTFETGSPSDNGAKFCLYCGGSLDMGEKS